MADWSSLDRDILEKVGEKVVGLHTDYVRSRAVCVNWRSTLPEKPKPLHLGLPSLILPAKHNDQDNNQSQSRGFLSLFDGNVYDLELPEEVSGEDKLFRGSSHGWIAVVGKTPSIYLFNPLLNQLLELPPVTTFPEVLDYQPDRVGNEYGFESPNQDFLTLQGMRDLMIQKIVLSSSPTANKDYVAMAIYGIDSALAFCRRGDERWIIFGRNSNGFNDFYSDIIFCNGNVYAVDFSGVLYSILISDLLGYSSTTSSPIRPLAITAQPKGIGHPSKLYLVESFGNILLVIRYIVDSKSYEPGTKSAKSYRTTNFQVFRLDLNSSSSTTKKWPKKKEKSLGNQVLFLGYNDTFCLPSRNFTGSKGNRIYFTDDCFEGHIEGKKGGADIGVFNYKYKTVSPLPGYNHHSQLVWPPPIWFMPPN